MEGARFVDVYGYVYESLVAGGWSRVAGGFLPQRRRGRGGIDGGRMFVNVKVKESGEIQGSVGPMILIGRYSGLMFRDK